jgi:hypothetical protein
LDRTEAEARRIIAQLSKYVTKKYLVDKPIFQERKGKKLKEFTAKPTRADFYPKGLDNVKPLWRKYF